MGIQFRREDTPTIMDGLVVRYKVSTAYPHQAEVSASKHGVLISGAWPLLESVEDVEAVVRQLWRAYEQYQHLRATGHLWHQQPLPDGGEVWTRKR